MTNPSELIDALIEKGNQIEAFINCAQLSKDAAKIQRWKQEQADYAAAITALSSLKEVGIERVKAANE